MLFSAIISFAAAVLPATFAALPVGYVELSGAAKRDILWNRINGDPHIGKLPTANPGVVAMASMFNPIYLVKAFTTESDEWEDADHIKLMHTYGSVALVRLNIFNNSIYSGIFKNGSSSPALIRLSMAKHDPDNFILGLALKVLIDGKASQNIVAMNSWDGQGKDKNVFANPMSNIVRNPTSFSGKLLVKAFSLALTWLPGGAEARPWDVNDLSLQEHASVDSQGNVPEKVVAPYRITFIPNPALAYSPDAPEDFRLKLANVTAGSVLYTVALSKPNFSMFTIQNGLQFTLGPNQVIGEVVSEGAFIASKYADRNLHFQHHRMPFKF